MSANVLKMIALVAMTIDHMGYLLFPDCEWMRIVGRIAFPIFAFMIAEGCRYTRDRPRYFGKIALLGVGMQIFLYIATGSLYQSVFISFALAILLIFAIDKAETEKTKKSWIGVAVVIWVLSFLCMGLPKLLYQTDYAIDYGIIGVMIPVVCYLVKGKMTRILALTLCLIALSAVYGGIQWFCLLAVPLIGTYNYQRGKFRLKNLFYVYYPAHLSVIYMIDRMIN